MIFLIDDDPDDQDFFLLAMQRAKPGVHCAFAEDCSCAMDRLRDSAFNPQLIFIDINMPRMNGVDCLKEVRRIPRLRSVPAYMYSTSADDRMMELCLRLGASGFLKKHVTIAEAEKDFEHILATLNRQ
ncbi:MAG TPA: response regulator [Puia sp.]|nr:response regulator [Puia sp.]